MSNRTDSPSKQIKAGAVVSYLTIIINIILGMIYTPWILHEVGSSNYGLYTLASSLIAIFLLDFGISAAVTRYIANYRAENNQDGINSFVGEAIKLYLIICASIALILSIIYANIELIYVKFTPEEIASFRIVFVITAFFVVLCFPVNICNGILNAYECFIELKVADIISKLGTVVVTIVALLLHGGIYALVFISGFLNLIAFAVKITIIKKKLPIKISLKKKKNLHLKGFFSFSTWTTINTMANQMIWNLTPSVLGMVVNTKSITLFGFANVIEGYVYNITQAINGLFLPSISRIVVNTDSAENTLPLMIKVGRVNQSVVTLLLLGLTVLGKEFVHLWVGDEYSDLYYCILLLSYPYFISASQQIANSSIIVLNKVKYMALINLFTCLLNIVVSYFVAQLWGVVGVCASICIISFIRILLLNIVYAKKLCINVGKFFVSCHLRMVSGIILSYILGFAVMHFMPTIEIGFYAWGLFVLKVIILIFIFFFSMWLFSWNDNEKAMLANVSKKILNGFRK